MGQDEWSEAWRQVREGRASGAWWEGLQNESQRGEHVAGEFPAGALDPPDPMSRRTFVQLMGASMALAGLTGCVREPSEQILSYVDAPPDVIPGVARHYATSMTLDGYATGLVVESHEGRPTKVEGNPEHPASLGAAGVYEQASLLQLYDPFRARSVRAGRRRSSWESFSAAFQPEQLRRRVGARGAGLRLLLEPTASPLVIEWLGRVRERFPDAGVCFHAPLASQTSLSAARDVLGAALVPLYALGAADIVVALDDDVLGQGPFRLRYARDFGERRRADRAHTRLYVAETAPSPTGTLADLRIAAAPGTIGTIAAALAQAVARRGTLGGHAAVDGVSATCAPELEPAVRRWVDAVSADLTAHAGRSIVIAGPRQPAAVHAMVHALNAMTGAIGRTVTYVPSSIYEAGEASHDLARFCAELRGGGVDTLIILEGNPAYAVPVDLELSRLMRAIPNTLYLGLYDDETARASTWHLPAAHYLESWGDARAYDGTASLVQPLIAPLYDGKTVADVLTVLAGAGGGERSMYELLRTSWQTSAGTGSGFDAWWEMTLRHGVVVGSAAVPRTPSVRWDAVRSAHAALCAARDGRDTLQVAFVPSPAVYDGRFANNPWLQELPDPITKLTWDNAALLSPALATRLGVGTGDVITVQHGTRALDIPALVVPGHADGAVSLPLGYGRGGGEVVARSVGSNVNLLRTAGTPYIDTGLRVTRTGRHVALSITQRHWTLGERRDEIVRTVTATFQGNPRPSPALPTPPRPRRPLTLYTPPVPSPDGFGADQWAMVIDLDSCTGCSACVVACQAENNIPVVGREGVRDGREMQWLRIDHYVEGPLDAPEFISQPMLCQHCEKAPCEYVCPVDATVHSDDGLNEMIYNRCVGTRFCSNNCPYKVRRFNWFDYNAEIAETERMAKNPDVTVRGRGVMEKCTFCVQRIRKAQLDASLRDDPRTGPVMTACQQTCPTRAISFGSLTDPTSDVARLREDPRAYAVLESLGTEPRVRYLARVRNAPTSSTGTAVDDR